MAVTEAEIAAWIAQYFWPFCRIGAFLFALPLIGTKTVSMRVRMVITLAITAIIAPLLPAMPDVGLMSLSSFIIIAQQMLIGFAMGFLVQILFQIFVVGGQLVAMQNGLGFATLVDPTNGVSITAISQIYLMTVNLVFFALDGHLALIRMIVESFTSLPVGLEGVSGDALYRIVQTGSWMLSNAVLLALPAVIALLVVNAAFGVMSRVAPQLNIISIGFPLNMVFGAVILWLTLTNIVPQFERTMDETFIMLKQVGSSHGR